MNDNFDESADPLFLDCLRGIEAAIGQKLTGDQRGEITTILIYLTDRYETVARLVRKYDVWEAAGFPKLE
jgi:hypothetical protein